MALAAMAATFFFLSSCGKEEDSTNDGNNTTGQEWRITHIAKIYEFEYPFPSSEGYDYDALARISVKHDTLNKGTDYETSGDINFSYEDGMVVLTQNGGSDKFVIENGRVVTWISKYGATEYRTTMEYDDNNHLVKEITPGSDTTIYIWNGEDLVGRYIHYFGSVKRIVRETYTPSAYPFSAFPMNGEVYVGIQEVSQMGLYGKNPAHLPLKLEGKATDEDGTVEYVRDYEYVITDSRVDTLRVNTNSSNYSYAVKWGLK